MQSRLLLCLGLVSLPFGAAPAVAQMYSNGPGFYMSLEGRYLQNSGDRTRLSVPSDSNGATDSFATQDRKAKDWGGKAAFDYRFQNNWDIGVSASGLKNLR